MIDYNNYHFKKLLSKDIHFVIKEIVSCVHIQIPPKNPFYRRNVKYSIQDYAIGIIDVIKNSSSYNSYNGIIKGNTLRKKHAEWCKKGVYEMVYNNMLNEYFKKVPSSTSLKNQSIDSTFIIDVNGSKDAGFSGIYKKGKSKAAKGVQITSIVESNGIPISMNISSANKYDSTLLQNTVNHCFMNPNTEKRQHNNKHKQYFLADSGYDSKSNIHFLKKKGYVPLIKQNRRNIKNKKLLQKWNNKQKRIYKKRNIIENYHSWIKKFVRIKSLYEKKMKYYEGNVLLCISIITSRRINNTVRTKVIK